jgi:mannitol operon transcriptional antiterminator
MAAVPNIKLVSITSFKDWKEDYNNYDIILSTINIDDKDNKNILIVSPFLNNEDVTKINDFIKQYSTENYMLNRLTKLSSNDKVQDFKKEEFDIVNDILANLKIDQLSSGSFNEMVKSITQMLHNEKIINDEKEIENLIIKRQQMGNVVIPNCHVALIHTRSDNVRTPFVGTYRLKQQIRLKSIGFEDENVDTFIVLLARRNEASYVLESMGKISISLIENKQFTEILRYGDLKDLRSSLIKILNEGDS